MNLLQKLKQQALAQTVGSIFILISGILALTKISGIAPDFVLIKNTWWPYIFLTGAFFYCYPKIVKNLKKLLVFH